MTKYVIPIVVIVLALLGANGLYVVGQGHAAIVSRMGRVEAAAVGPGLHFKLPYVQTVTLYDTREIASQAEPVDAKTRDGQAVRAGFDARWRIVDPARWFAATAGNELQTLQQMMPQIRAALQAQIAQRDLADVLVAGGRDIGEPVRAQVAGAIRAKLGIDLLAVSVGRVLPPDTALTSLYKRMTDEAQAQAGAVRAKGEEAAAGVRATGDAANQQVIAAADQAAAKVRGAGDAQAAGIYAAASAKDPSFFRYWSALETWRQSFSGGGAVVVLDRNSPFMQAVDAGAAGGRTAPPKAH